MIRVGLTGTIAAGKSSVGRLFQSWGASRVDADDLARQAVRPGSSGLSRVVALLGEDVLDSDAGLDRAAVRRRVFGDDAVRSELEAIVHAEVRRLRGEWLARETEAGTTIVVEEIPLLFETGLEDDYDALVVVDAPIASRRERAMASRGWTAEEFDSIDAAQLDGAEKRARATYVICNDGTSEELERAAREVWTSLEAAGAQD